MRKYVVLTLALAALAACAQPQPRTQAPTDEAKVAVPAAAPAAQPQASLYVDVRTPEEYAAGHLEGAINIPVDQMARRWIELKAYPERQIVLYCRSGHRAGIALDILRQQGFTSVTNGGGLEDLRRQGIK